MSFENSESRNNTKQKAETSLLVPGLVTQHSPVEQLPFPDSSPLSGQQVVQPVTALQTLEGPTSPSTTGDWPVTQPGALTVAKKNGTALRPPVIIHGSGKKSSGIMRPPKGQKKVVHIASTALLALVLVITLITVIPTGSQASNGKFNILFQPMGIFKAKGDNAASLIAAQKATAVAVTQDGFDAGAGAVYAGVPTGASAPGDHFFYGQCTDWAAKRYYALTGLWVPWLGNADEWAAGAQAYGWNVSGTPRLHSIIVLQPYVEGAGGYGHVAIVEQVNADGSVLTSNYNWAGNFAVETYVTFTPGPGVSFVWAPGH